MEHALIRARDTDGTTKGIRQCREGYFRGDIFQGESLAYSGCIHFIAAPSDAHCASGAFCWRLRMRPCTGSVRGFTARLRQSATHRPTKNYRRKDHLTPRRGGRSVAVRRQMILPAEGRSEAACRSLRNRPTGAGTSAKAGYRVSPRPEATMNTSFWHQPGFHPSPAQSRTLGTFSGLHQPGYITGVRLEAVVRQG